MTAPHYSNPHAAAMAEHAAAKDAALRTVRSLASDLAWFDGLDVPALEKTAGHVEATRATLIKQLAAATAARAAMPESTPQMPISGAGAVATAAVAMAAVPIAPIVSGIAIAVTALLRGTSQRRDAGAAERQHLDASIKDYRQRIATIGGTLANHRATLSRVRAFDRAGICERLEEAQAAHDQADELLTRTIRDHAAAEAQLRPLASELAAAEAAEVALRDATAAAMTYQRQLGEAPTKSARARIHTACEEKFGNGSPAEVLKNLRRKLAGAERTTAKWRDRLNFMTNAVTHVIDHLVLDGSNLSYALRGGQRRFIGLTVLDALVPQLAKQYRVTVVFDASTRKRLDIPRRELEQRYGDRAEIHVVAAGHGADLTILRCAEAPTSWVVTNDQLRDYTDQSAVKEKRVLRYEQLAGMVEIPMLDFKVQWSA